MADFTFEKSVIELLQSGSLNLSELADRVIEATAVYNAFVGQSLYPVQSEIVPVNPEWKESWPVGTKIDLIEAVTHLGPIAYPSIYPSDSNRKFIATDGVGVSAQVLGRILRQFLQTLNLRVDVGVGLVKFNTNDTMQIVNCGYHLLNIKHRRTGGHTAMFQDVVVVGDFVIDSLATVLGNEGMQSVVIYRQEPSKDFNHPESTGSYSFKMTKMDKVDNSIQDMVRSQIGRGVHDGPRKAGAHEAFCKTLSLIIDNASKLLVDVYTNTAGRNFVEKLATGTSKITDYVAAVVNVLAEVPGFHTHYHSRDGANKLFDAFTKNRELLTETTRLKYKYLMANKSVHVTQLLARALNLKFNVKATVREYLFIPNESYKFLVEKQPGGQVGFCQDVRAPQGGLYRIDGRDVPGKDKKYGIRHSVLIVGDMAYDTMATALGNNLKAEQIFWFDARKKANHPDGTGEYAIKMTNRTTQQQKLLLLPLDELVIEMTQDYDNDQENTIMRLDALTQNFCNTMLTINTQ
jgi:hypothetical protein